METQNIWVVVTENPGIEIRIVKKATDLEKTQLPDGSRSTADNVLTKVDNNQFTWESQNRTLDGESQPSVPKIVVHRATANP